MRAVADELKQALVEFGYNPDRLFLERMEAFHRLLVERNRSMDLTNVPEEQMPRRHYTDSLWPFLADPSLISQGENVLDVGSGAGFPGLPLAILMPDQPITLLEANGKRCTFLREAVQLLGLDKVNILERRAEEAGRDTETRERYRVTVSRAVAALPELLEYMLPLTAPGGYALCWKGQKAEEEMAGAARAARLLGAGALVCLNCPDTTQGSCLVRADKTGLTPSVYPRRTGIPHKRPIL